MNMTLRAKGKSRTCSRRAQFARQKSCPDIISISTDELIQLIELGFPFTMLKSLSSRTGIAILDLAATLRISERTLARRKAAGRLAPEESERLLRIATMFEKTVQLFEGETAAAISWFKSPKKALSNYSPLQYGRFEVGAREVETLIGRLEHGVFS